MPYNLDLEKMIDPLAAGLDIDEKKKMFGGLCYLKGGKMVFGIHKQWLILRIKPEHESAWLEKKGVKPFNITGRPMKGWLVIEPEEIEKLGGLTKLLALSHDYVQNLL
jgi:hypothetical protein